MILCAVSVGAYIKAGQQGDADLSTGWCFDAVRGVFDHGPGRGHGRFRLGHDSTKEDTNLMGSGLLVRERGRAALSAGAKDRAIDDSHHAWPRCRCPLGDGRRPAMCCPGRSDRRDLGRSAGSGLHRHPAACRQGPGDQTALLADAPGRHSRPQRRPEPLAHHIACIRGASPRSPGPRQSPLAGRAVPLASRATRYLGGDL
jgi:hypothetical protein